MKVKGYTHKNFISNHLLNDSPKGKEAVIDHVLRSLCIEIINKMTIEDLTNLFGIEVIDPDSEDTKTRLRKYADDGLSSRDQYEYLADLIMECRIKNSILVQSFLNVYKKDGS